MREIFPGISCVGKLYNEMIVIDATAAIRNRQALQAFSTWSYPKEGLQHAGDATDEGNGGKRVYSHRVMLRFTPKFKLAADSVFFAAGSCFAREIEIALFKAGRKVTSWNPGLSIPEEQFHRYNTFSIMGDFALASNDGYDSRNVVAISDVKYVDYTGYVAGGTAQEVIDARSRVVEVHKNAFTADVIIITLGLVEVWYDKQTFSYLNLIPYELFRREPNRFELRITDYGENRQALRKFVKRLARANPKAKVILTVSPVPFTDTFSGQDVIVANSYSKAVLRSVAQDVAGSFDFVDYFPSYEIVTLSDPRTAWLSDHRHVQADHVGHIVAEFARCYID